MSVQSTFASYLASQVGATIGQDMFIGQAPSSNKVADSIWWVTASGGDILKDLMTNGKVKNYLVEVFYRNRDYDVVYDKLHDLEEDLNSAGCVDLAGFDCVKVDASTFPIDNDLDAEDRKIGLLQARLTIYKGG